MFEKKEVILEALTDKQYRNLLQEKNSGKLLNHQVQISLIKFFLLVRNQQYEEAYSLGLKILSRNPNQSVYKFCKFIQENLPQLKEMVDSQKYQEQSSEDEDSNSNQDSESEQDELQENKSESSQTNSQISSKNSISSKKSYEPIYSINNKKLKENTSCINKVHKWGHSCKNVKCPNKKR